MVKSSNEGSWLQNKRWSRIELSGDGFTFVKVNRKISIVLLTLLSSPCLFQRNRKHYIFHIEIYTQRKTQGGKVNDLYNGKCSNYFFDF